MKKRLLSRILALLLAVLMLPVSEAFAAEDYFEISVPYKDVYSGYEGEVTLYEFAGSGYYISLQEAADMLRLTLDGEKFCGANGLVIVEPNLYRAGYKTVNNEKVYGLNGLMDELYTYAFAALDGTLAYSSVPANFDSLLSTCAKFMKDGTYSADIFQNMDGIEAVTGFAWIYDTVWNFFDKITGKTTKEDYHDILLKLLQPCDTPESIAKLAETGAKHTEKIVDYTLKAQGYYDDFYQGLELPVPGDGYLLFGKDGTGTLRECMEVVKGIDDSYGLSTSDIIGVGIRLFEVKRISGMYSDAFDTVLYNTRIGGKRWKAMRKKLTYKAGDSVIRDYNKYLNDYSSYVFKDGAVLLAKEWLQKKAKGKIQDAVGFDAAAKIAKKSIDFIDPYLVKVNKKNDAVRDISIITDIQNFMVYAYNRSDDVANLAKRAALCRSSALLYLKCAWLSYDTVSFDKDTKAASAKMKEKIEGWIACIAEIDNSIFTNESKTDILEGVLSMNRSKTAPDGEAAKYHDMFIEYVKSYDWLSYVSFDISDISKKEYSKIQWGSYFFCDVDKDGTDELIIHAGRSGADGSTMVFSSDGKNIAFRGLVECCGLPGCAGIFVSEKQTGFLLYEVQMGGYGGGFLCDFVNGSIQENPGKYYSDVPDNWKLIDEYEI